MFAQRKGGRLSEDEEGEVTKGKLFFPRVDLDLDWQPTSGAVLKLLFSFRLSAALWSGISDCDEVYNYWEPLHLLLYGNGLQTWEYSPVYSIRSWMFIVMHSMPASILLSVLPPSKIAIFVTMRCTLGFIQSFADFCLYKAICHRLGTSISRFYVILSMLSAGMFISSSAFLPSSFAMVLTSFALAALFYEEWFLSVLCVGTAALLGWPFAALLGIPTVVKLVFVRGRPTLFVLYSLMTLLVVGMPILFVDTWYYGKRVFAPLNIILYNIFSSHGPNLYGVEPAMYYIKNLALNWNICCVLFPLSLPLSTLLHCVLYPPTRNVKRFFGFPYSLSYYKRLWPLFLVFASCTLWLAVFFSQPHKEERFLFPVYPLIAILSAVTLDALHRLSRRCSLSSPSYVLLTLFVIFSSSRALSLYRNYSASMEVYKSLNENLLESRYQMDFQLRNDAISVCVGKEWHRFPSSFFLPQTVVDKHGTKRAVRLEFLQSEFRGLLPKYFSDGSIPNITRSIPSGMNDMNEEDPSRYVSFDTCEYLIDLNTNETTELEPNYGEKFAGLLRKVASHSFLLSRSSHWLARAFYIPLVTDGYCTFGEYTLYQRTSPTIRKTKKIMENEDF